MSFLVGVVGFIGSGKGTIGDYLVSDWRFKNDSFAKPLKDAVSIIFGWDRELIEGQTKESREWREQVDEYWSKVMDVEMTPRLALQLFGTECIREVFHPNVWSASLIKRYQDSGVNTVVTDCRFKNEVKAIKDAGGYVIRVKRGEEPDWYEEYNVLMERGLPQDLKRIESLRESGYIPHVSETDWIGSEFNFILNNDGSLEDLYKHIDIAITLMHNDKGKKHGMDHS